MRGSAAPIDLIASTPDNGALWCIRAPPRRGDRLPAQERPRPPSRQPQTRPDRRLGDAPCARNRSSRSNRVPGCRDRDVPSEVLAGGADRGVGIRPVSTARMRLGRLVPVSQRVPVPRSSAPSDGLGTRVACSLAGTSRQQQSSLQTTTQGACFDDAAAFSTSHVHLYEARRLPGLGCRGVAQMCAAFETTTI